VEEEQQEESFMKKLPFGCKILRKGKPFAYLV